MTPCIVGWAHTPFGKLSDETVESLIVRVANAALAEMKIPMAARAKLRERLFTDTRFTGAAETSRAI